MKTVIVLLATMLLTLGLSTSAASQNRWRIDRITPERVYVMNKFDLVGSGFGDSQPRHTVVLMMLNNDGRHTIYKLRILTWSRKRIRLETPDLASPGNYTIGIYVRTESNLMGALEPLDAGPRGSFIAAFEWSVARRNDFLWPFESMRPANYGSVRMVVSTMPWVVVDGKKGKRTEPLTASGHLRINGRLQEPVRPVRPENKQTEQQEFLVRLDQGRLRLTLIVPRGTTLDPEHAFIRIKLYEATKPAPTPNWRVTTSRKNSYCIGQIMIANIRA